MLILFYFCIFLFSIAIYFLVHVSLQSLFETNKPATHKVLSNVIDFDILGTLQNLFEDIRIRPHTV